MDPRESRLPKWAQSELMTLRRMLADVQAHNAELRGQWPADGNTAVAGWGERPSLPLGDETHIEFTLDTPGYTYRPRLFAYAKGDALCLSGDTSIIIEPQVSNSVRIRFRDFR